MPTIRQIERLLDIYEEKIFSAGSWIETEKSRPVLNAIRAKLREPITLSFVGDFSVGKSMVINSLLGEHLAPTATGPTTAIITYICYGPKQAARFHFRSDPEAGIEESSFDCPLDYFQQLVGRANEVREVGTSQEKQELINRTTYVEVFIPNEFLRDVSIIDTPGFGSMNERDDTTTMNHLKEADAVCWVFNAQNVGKKEEIERIQRLQQYFRTTFAVINRCDEKSPSERLALKRRVEEVCPGIFKDVFLYSGLNVLQAAQADSEQLADDDEFTEHLTTDLTGKIIEYIRSDAERIRCDRALGELQALAAWQALECQVYIEKLQNIRESLCDQLPKALNEVVNRWQQHYPVHRRNLEQRWRSAIEGRQAALQRCFYYKAGGLWSTGEWSIDRPEAAQQVNNLNAQMQTAIEPFQETVLLLGQECGELLEKTFENVRTQRGEDVLIKEIEEDMSVVYGIMSVEVPYRLLNFPLIRLATALFSWYRSYLASHSEEGLLGQIANLIHGMRAERFAEYMTNIMDLQAVLSYIDEQVRGGKGYASVFQEFIDRLHEVAQRAIENLKPQYELAQTLKDWLTRVVQADPSIMPEVQAHTHIETLLNRMQALSRAAQKRYHSGAKI